MNRAHLSIGSNKGNRLQFLKSAVEKLEFLYTIEKVSSVYETEAWGVSDQADFLNQVVIIRTDQDPKELLSAIQAIEIDLEKDYEYKWGPRNIDLDILFYEDRIIDTNTLIVPHPHIQERRFILKPLAEIDPEYIHPVSGKSINALLDSCKDQLIVKQLENV